MTKCARAFFLLSVCLTADAETKQEVSQWGITWRFSEPAEVGRFVTGDWWVVGPVRVEAMTPAPRPGRHGSVVNPAAGAQQSYDDRAHGYDASPRASFPLTLEPGQSLVSTVSVDKVGVKTPDTVRGQYCRGPIRTAAVLTCLEVAPPANAFRPAYVGTWKKVYTTEHLHLEHLPRLAAPVKPPAPAPYERCLQRIWLDHQREWVNRMMHPLENMPDYGREITNITSTIALLMALNDSENRLEKLRLQFIQLGIDYYGTVLSNDTLWTGNGGHNSGRKIPILFAGLLLEDRGMLSLKAKFAEDDQTYFGKGYRGQKALYMISPGNPNRHHEEHPPSEWQTYGKGANNGWKSEGYRQLNGPTWVGAGLAARLLGLEPAWNHECFFAYVDRWVSEDGLKRPSKGDTGAGTFRAFNSPFVKAMWETYREKSDEIGKKNRQRVIEIRAGLEKGKRKG